MNIAHLPDKAMLGYKALIGSKGLLNILSKSTSPLQVSGLLVLTLYKLQRQNGSLSFRSVDIKNRERSRRDVAVTDSSSPLQPPIR